MSSAYRRCQIVYCKPRSEVYPREVPDSELLECQRDPASRLSLRRHRLLDPLRWRWRNLGLEGCDGSGGGVVVVISSVNKIILTRGGAVKNMIYLLEMVMVVVVVVVVVVVLLKDDIN